MLRRLLNKLLNVTKHSGGSHYRPHHSSDDYRKHGNRRDYDRHNQYGHSYYKKKRSSGSYSS